MGQNLTEWMGGHPWVWAANALVLVVATLLIARGVRD